MIIKKDAKRQLLICSYLYPNAYIFCWTHRCVEHRPYDSFGGSCPIYPVRTFPVFLYHIWSAPLSDRNIVAAWQEVLHKGPVWCSNAPDNRTDLNSRLLQYDGLGGVRVPGQFHCMVSLYRLILVSHFCPGKKSLHTDHRYYPGHYHVPGFGTLSAFPHRLFAYADTCVCVYSQTLNFLRFYFTDFTIKTKAFTVKY